MTSEQCDWLYRFHAVNGLEKLEQLKTKYLRNQAKIKYIHITGTNGKGSVSRYLHNILTKGLNLKVGLFTSPHITFLNERIVINGVMISDEDLLKIKNLINDDIEKYQLGFFTILTLIALIYFQQENVQWAIIEVGIGGLKDSTNIIKSDYCVITSIAKDHSDFLGNSKKQILKQKLGIIKQQTQVLFVSGNLNYLLKQRVKNYVKNKVLTLVFSPKVSKQTYYHQNQQLVMTIVNYLFPNLAVNEINTIIAKTIINLRFEKIKYQDKILYLDVAHNRAGIKALIKMLKFYHIEIDQIIFSALTDKKPKQLLKLLKRKVNKNIVICANSHMRSISGAKFNLQQHIINIPNKNLLITGSCYFVADVYNLFSNND